ncbi:MAG TPA: 50S ribosomal protein L11 methyltransferase [Burkholderiales bacterium]|nr:50S ribosomal protein L11 methyltransferase [Burkholderiales bacterium]
MPFLDLRVEVERGAAEALSDALLELGAHSTSIDHPDMPHVVLNGLFGTEQDPLRLLDAAARACGVSTGEARVSRVDDEDWVRRSQAQFEPLRVGPRLWIGASWHRAPPDAAHVVRLDPGLAFGTGSHPSTKLVLGFLERAIAGGERVLDYGCGSGILAIAAAKLGAAQVDAVDIDQQSVEVTLGNAQANGVRVRACLPAALAPGAYDIVVANILAQPLIALAAELTARTAPGGRIALAGILSSQAHDVAAPYAEAFDMEVTARDGDWALLCGLRR